MVTAEYCYDKNDWRTTGSGHRIWWQNETKLLLSTQNGQKEKCLRIFGELIINNQTIIDSIIYCYSMQTSVAMVRSRNPRIYIYGKADHLSEHTSVKLDKTSR